MPRQAAVRLGALQVLQVLLIGKSYHYAGELFFQQATVKSVITAFCRGVISERESMYCSSKILGFQVQSICEVRNDRVGNGV